MADKKSAKKGIWNLYEKKGNDVTCKNKSCPKCGQGHFMAHHSNRWVCGGCKYVEYVKGA